ncbi:hypothetical protein [Kitasatospora sp. MAA4]|uniref:hypothetical protein n=1 Tax=Kitasatospora sp. MAA4 TaxID=3035093 RepID=UPI002476ED35|nr:hypothetical protein [Kitasatospora sp. MAA4]
MGGLVPVEGRDVERFVELSVKLTGFDAGELGAAGVAAEYLWVVSQQLGAERYERLADALDRLEPAELADEGLREAARAVAHLWYLGVWPGIGPEQAFVASARSAAQGLVWRTIDGQAPGTPGPGPGSWARPPQGAGR